MNKSDKTLVNPNFGHTFWRNFIIKHLICRCLAAIELARGRQEHRSRADGKDIGGPVGQPSNLLQQHGIPHQRHHAEPSGDEERVALLLMLESVGQG